MFLDNNPYFTELETITTAAKRINGLVSSIFGNKHVVEINHDWDDTGAVCTRIGHRDKDNIELEIVTGLQKNDLYASINLYFASENNVICASIKHYRNDAGEYVWSCFSEGKVPDLIPWSRPLFDAFYAQEDLQGFGIPWKDQNIIEQVAIIKIVKMAMFALDIFERQARIRNNCTHEWFYECSLCHPCKSNLGRAQDGHDTTLRCKKCDKRIPIECGFQTHVRPVARKAHIRKYVLMLKWLAEQQALNTCDHDLHDVIVIDETTDTATNHRECSRCDAGKNAQHLLWGNVDIDKNPIVFRTK